MADYVSTHPVYADAHKAKFLSKADSWLISAAKYLEATIVTHEKRVNAQSSKVKIPNVADAFGVKTIDTFELMRRLGAQLTLKAEA